MEREELIDDLSIGIKDYFFSLDGSSLKTREMAKKVAELVLHRMTEDLHLSIASLRQVGWAEHDTHTLHELDTDEDYAATGWVPVYEVGSTAIGLPPIDLDDDGAWGDS